MAESNETGSDNEQPAVTPMKRCSGCGSLLSMSETSCANCGAAGQ